MNLTHEQILFLAKLTSSAAFKTALDEAHEAVAPGTHRVEPFCVEVGGAFDKAEDSERAGTVKALSLVTLAIALQHAGVTREAALDAIEHGLKVRGVVADCTTQGVDRPGDVALVEHALTGDADQRDINRQVLNMNGASL